MQRTLFRILSRPATWLLCSAALSACGGGGGSSNDSSQSGPAPAPVNQPPTAAISASSTDGFAPLQIDFDGRTSADSDGQISTYLWDFGDGSATESGAQVSHLFDDPGGYNVSLTVTDDDGATDSVLQNVRIRGTRLTGTIQILSTSAVDGDRNDRLTQPVANNSFQSAQALGNPVRLGGYVNLPGTGASTGNLFASGDAADFFAVSLSGNELIVLNIGDADADLDLRLWDANQDLVDASLGIQPTESLSVPLAGDYFVEVFPASAATNSAGGSNYVLSIGQDLSISGRAPSRLSDAFVPGEILLADRAGRLRPSSRRAIHEAYDLAERGRAGRFARAVLGAGLEEKIRRRLNRGQPEPPIPAMSSRMASKYRTLLAVKALPRDAAILAAEPNLLLAANLEPNDELYPNQWHLTQISLPAAWDLSTGTPTGPDDIIIAVVDTGILPNHPDFIGKLVNGYDFIADPDRARDFDGIDPDPTDEGDFAFGAASSFHGTHVAGTAAARTDNIEGVAGVSWGARLMPLRALGVDGGTSFDVLQAVRFAAGLSNDSGTTPAQSADVINLSLGSPFFSASAQATFDEVRASGVIVIASAGNESSDTPSYPAAYDGVISVSATTIDGSIAPYSNFGAIDIAAPGGYNGTDLNGDGLGDGVFSTLGDDSNSGSLVLGYGALNGTSMAAPHVAGVVALMKAVHPDLTPQQFDNALVAGELTDDTGTPGYDQFYGHGLLNAQKAVVEALSLSNGGGTDPGPVLASSLSSINLGVLATTRRITLRNIGTGSIQILSTIASQPWLTINPAAVDANGLGDYDLLVDRSGLGPGSYSANARFVPLDPTTNSVTVSVTLQVLGASPDADAGLFYVIAVNPDGSTEGAAAVVAVSGGEYAFTLNDLPAGSYQIFGGSDMDDDDFLCDAGEACGAYRTLDSLEQVQVDPASDPEITGIDFVAEFRAVITNQSLMAGSVAGADARDDAAVAFQKPAPPAP